MANVEEMEFTDMYHLPSKSIAEVFYLPACWSPNDISDFFFLRSAVFREAIHNLPIKREKILDSTYIKRLQYATRTLPTLVESAL